MNITSTASAYAIRSAPGVVPQDSVQEAPHPGRLMPLPDPPGPRAGSPARVARAVRSHDGVCFLFSK